MPPVAHITQGDSQMYLKFYGFKAHSLGHSSQKFHIIVSTSLIDYINTNEMQLFMLSI